MFPMFSTFVSTPTLNTCYKPPRGSQNSSSWDQWHLDLLASSFQARGWFLDLLITDKMGDLSL
jgi:hypothetical protein